MQSSRKYDFIDKVVIVTGSSNGMGAVMATQFAAYGARVTITGRDATTLDKVAAKIAKISGGTQPVKIVGDFLDESYAGKIVSETIEKYGQLDVLINNAGTVSPTSPTLDSPKLLDEYDRLMRINLRSVIRMTQLAATHLAKTKGCIVNISSVASMKPYSGGIAYGASKAALDMVTKTCALELGPKGVRVNAICPGPVSTAMIRDMSIDTEQWNEIGKNLTILSRTAQPKEIADFVCFLASNDAVNITGSILVNDGGMLLKA